MNQKKIIEDKWNSIFMDFLNQMQELFPDSPASTLKTKLTLGSYFGTKPILIFLNHLDEHAEEIQNENEEYFFNDSDIEFVKEMDLGKYYNLSNDNNKKTIWSFIKTLYQLSKAYNSFWNWTGRPYWLL